MQRHNLKPSVCLYCGNSFLGGDREHVFPKGLGGQSIFLDSVCSKCNKIFSKYEAVLMRDSPISLIRSVEGLEGYGGNRTPSPFRAPILLSFDPNHKVVYEVGQHYPLNNFVRPQIIRVEDIFYIEGDTQPRLQLLVKTLNVWRRGSRFIVIKEFNGSNSSLRWMELLDKQTHYEWQEVNAPTNKKGVMKMNILSNKSDLFPFLDPRCFLDDDDELWVRARSIDEGILFIAQLMHHTRASVLMSSFPKGDFSHPVIYVGQNWSSSKFLQAVVKIGINCLMYYYPQTQNDKLLSDYISFVLSGNPEIEVFMDQSVEFLPDTNTHSVIFQQTEQGIGIGIGFFSGRGGVYRFLIKNLNVLNPNETNCLVVDYKTRLMTIIREPIN